MASITAVDHRTLVGPRSLARRPTWEFVTASVLAGLLAVLVPLHTVVLGLVVFGIVHNAFELRYVLGRFHHVLHGPFLAIMLAAVSGIALRRLLVGGDLGAVVEIGLGYGVLAIGLILAARDRLPVLLPGLAVILVAAGASAAQPDLHFVVITHLHNLVPLVFLWEWSRRLPRPSRATFRGAQLGWLLAVPALFLTGSLDRWLPGLPEHFGDLSVAGIVNGYTPPALTGIDVWPVRFLAVFAFLQAMHYFVWCGFLPRHAPEAAAEFDRRVPIGVRFGGRRLIAGAVIAAGALAVVFWQDYLTGRSLYQSVSTYHAYLEWPVILALVLGLRQPTSGPAPVGQSTTPRSAR